MADHPHGFEAGELFLTVFFHTTRQNARSALKQLDQARLGDRQELVEAVAKALAADYGWNWDGLKEREAPPFVGDRQGLRLSAQAALNAVADHLGMELTR